MDNQSMTPSGDQPAPGTEKPALIEADALASLLKSRGIDSLGLGELKLLLSLLREQYAPLFARRKQIALVGPVNTGKSSLYNALILPRQAKAPVSPVPGTTRTAQAGDADIFWVIDTPGANETEIAGEDATRSARRQQEARDAAARADVLVMVFDAARGIARDEVSIYRDLISLHKPSVIVLNKIDLVGKAQEAVIESAAQNLQVAADRIVATSALRRTNINGLLLALVEADAELMAPLAELLPNARWLLATRIIMTSSVAAATANLMTAPAEIPLASFVVITPIQIAMTLKLARIFGRGLTPVRARELAITFGSAVLGRRIFYYLANMVPVAGWALGTAIAAGTTMALGYSIASWFAGGEKLSRDNMRLLADAVTRALVDSIRQYPERGSLRENIPAVITDTWKRIGEIAAQYHETGKATR